jgi:hypothetical protein
MLFDLAFDDEPTMILVRDDYEVEEPAAEPPALPFPLVRQKTDPEPEPAAFELVAPRRRRACA